MKEKHSLSGDYSDKMGFLQSFSLLLLRHPSKVLIAGVSLVLLFFTITLHIHPFPSFRDPLVGFEVRGTPITARLNTWRLLVDETSASANNLSLIPNSPKYDSYLSSTTYRLENDINHVDNISASESEPPIVEMSTQQIGHNSTGINTIMDEGEDEYYQSINSTRNLLPALMHYSLDSSKAFCGKLYEGYAQVVVAPSINHSPFGLFNINSILAVCQIDQRLRLEHSEEDSIIFQRDCEQYQDEQQGLHKGTCCNSWSLPNYIACLNNKTTCAEIDFHDLKVAEQLLEFCAPYYYKAPYEECFTKLPKEESTSSMPSLNILSPASHDLTRSYCGSIPDKCLKCDGWIFNVLHYLTNENFMKNKQPSDNDTSNHIKITPSRINKHDRTNGKESPVNKLTYTSIFLPLAKSSSLMKYYHALSKYSLKTPYAQVKVMNLGLRSSLFEHLISDDMKLFIIALISILIVISIYTWSFILSFVILMIICLSLCLSYTIYELVLNIPIFPFMNLLAVVISFGICSDNAMLFCKHWTIQKTDQKSNGNSTHNQSNAAFREQANLDRMLKRAIISTSVATLATACSFIISAISHVTAVRCFCIFATLSVLTNYLLIVILLPPALILDSRLREFLDKTLSDKGPQVTSLINYAKDSRDKLLELGETFHRRWIFILVAKFKFYLIITFITLLICSSILVFHNPTLQPADDDDIQLLSRKHAFEQYDKNLKRQFAFERAKQGEVIGTSVKLFQETPETLPVRIVFGIKPTDNGNHFDPHDRGTLKFDQKFDFTDPKVQIWLLEFCQKLRQQRFIHPSSMADMSNCFLDTFKSWMDARSCRDPVRPELDRSPCCQSFGFPYSRHTLNKCIGEAINIMRKTPQFYPNINAGIRFFKNSSRVAAVIIEYQSNRLHTESFTKMEKFFNDIDEWVTWQINNTAPPSLKSGWFISSNLELLALQIELEQSTNTSIMLEVLFAMIALKIGTRDLVLTIAGTLTIGTIIIVTMAALILLRWTLGVAESILISLTIGLSIDFALHYSVAYSEGLRSRSNHGIIQRILGEVGSPIALAAVTTSLAGFVIVWSDILAYQELGVFLMLIAFVSWVTSTFFLLPMLATVDSIAEYGEQYSRLAVQRALKLLIDRL